MPTISHRPVTLLTVLSLAALLWVPTSPTYGQDKKDDTEGQLPIPGVATERDVARERSREST